MADKGRIVAVSSILLSLLPVIAAFQCHGVLLCDILISRKREQVALLNAAMEYNKALARLRHVKRRIIRRRRFQRKPGRTDQWWRNLFEGRMEESEWKKNFRMDRNVFMVLANEVRPFLQPSRGPRGDDVLSVEKQLAMTLYYLKDQGSILMTANAFGVALCTVSVVVRKVCHVLTNKCGPNVIKLPTTEQEMMELVSKMENKFGFPQGFGCVDGTHIPILSPKENPHDYFSYKMKHTLNVQAVCDYKGTFLDVDVRWPGSVHDSRVFSNSRINRMLSKGELPMLYREILPGYDKVPVLLLGDPAYPLLPYCMKEYPNPRSNEVIFNTMLRSCRNPIECAFGRLKARWQILNKRIDLGLSFVPTVIYACFVLHNFCEKHGMTVEDDDVARQIAHDRSMQPDTEPDRLYAFNTAEGTHVRNVITLMYREHIPH